MSQTTPTVTIQTENGPVVINMIDYDPDKHKLAGVPKKKTSKAAPVKYVVAKRDDMFFVVNGSDEDIVSDHVDPLGYDSEEKANGAIAMLTLQG